MSSAGITRRAVVAGGAALALAGCGSAMGSAPRPLTVAERAVTIATADGSAEAVLFHPDVAGGRWPAVLVWSDIAGLRATFKDVGRRLAAEGYTVLVPNAFYRSARLDGSTSPGALSAEQTTERLASWRAAASDEGIAGDTRAYMAWLDARPQTDDSRKAGAVGYNVGGAHAFRAAAALPDRFGAVVSLHGLGVATARPNSPHLLIGQTRATYFVAMAGPDDAREPGDKDDLAKAFSDAGLTGSVEVYPAAHGFAVADNPAYDAIAAEAVWASLLATLEAGLK